MASSASTRRNILLITLDHGPWETYLQNNLWENLTQVNKVYYESENPGKFDDDVKGFTEDGVLGLFQEATSILAFVQVPELKEHYDIFAISHGNDEAKNFTIPREAYIKFFYNIIYEIRTLKEKFEEYQKQYKGDPCLFKQIMEITELHLPGKFYTYTAVTKPTPEEIERFYNQTQRILYTFSNNYLKWFQSFESNTFFSIKEYTKRLDQIIPSDKKNEIYEKYLHAMFYVASMRDRMLFQLKLKEEFASPGNYIAMIGTAHLESIKKMFEEDETKWNITVFDHREFGINKTSIFRRTNAFSKLKRLLSFKSEPVTDIFGII